MVPHLVKWDQTMRSRGLVVLGINDGGIDTRLHLGQAVKKSKKTYPVLWDEMSKNVRKYGVRAFPSSVLIGADGKVLWAGIPLTVPMEEHVARIEKALESVDREALKAADSVFLRTEPGKLPDEAREPEEQEDR